MLDQNDNGIAGAAAMRKLSRSIAITVSVFLATGASAFAQSVGTDLKSVPAPDWVLDIPAGTWRAVSLNTPSDVDPADDSEANPNYPGEAPWRGSTGQKSVIDTWNGGAFASGYGSHGGLILFGGGHADYYGSEIYAFDMQSRRWSRLTNPYNGPFDWPYSDGEYPDGSPVPPHTYSYSAYDPETNSYILFLGLDALGRDDRGLLDIVHMFNFDTMEWRRSRHAPEPGGRMTNGGWAVYDSRRDLIWGEGGNNGQHMVSFDPTTDNGDGTYGTWIGSYPLKEGMTNTVAAYDPVNDIVVFLPWRYESWIGAIDLSNPERDDVELNVTGNRPEVAQSTGFTWSQSNRAFLQFGVSGDEVYELKHVSGDWDDGEWSWQLLTSPDNTVVPTTPANGVFDRFQVVTYADAEVAVVINSTEEAVYAFRVPQIIRPMPPSDLQRQE